MTLFISLLSVISITVYSVSMGLCFMVYGKTGKKIFQYAALAMFACIADSVFTVILNLLQLSKSTHPLIMSITLAFTITEIYLFAKIVYCIFQKAMSGAFYIWLCIIIIINGLISPFPIDLSVWLFIAFNISIVIVCGVYWDFLVRNSDTERHKKVARYNNLILVMAVCSVSILAYSIVNLSLFQKMPASNLTDLYIIFFDLIVAIWLMVFCQEEYEAHTSQPIKHAFQSQPAAPESAEEDDLIVGSPDQLESFRALYELTERETEIFKLILAGKSNQEISDALFITVGTVKAHVHSIFGKLDVSRRSQLMTLFLDHELNK